MDYRSLNLNDSPGIWNIRKRGGKVWGKIPLICSKTSWCKLQNGRWICSKMSWRKFAKWKVDLSQLIINPMALQKMFKISLIFDHFCRVPFVIIRLQSAKRRCKILMVLKTFIPEILPSTCLVLRSRLKDSISKMKRRGERG